MGRHSSQLSRTDDSALSMGKSTPERNKEPRAGHRILNISQRYCLGLSPILRIQIKDKR